MNEDFGRDPALVASDRAATRLAPPGFDPAYLERLESALSHYAAQYCEGWCLEAGGNFSDCGGCIARLTLEERK